MRGGMQSEAATGLYCICGKITSRIKFIPNGQVSIHFTKKSVYWHIFENGKTRRTFKEPEHWA